MKPKEKAKELIDKFYYYCFNPESNKDDNLKWTKQSALIAVDEIIKNNPHEIIEKWYVDSGGNKTDNNYFEMVSNQFYWQEVKQEIENYDNQPS